MHGDSYHKQIRVQHCVSNRSKVYEQRQPSGILYLCTSLRVSHHSDQAKRESSPAAVEETVTAREKHRAADETGTEAMQTWVTEKDARQAGGPANRKSFTWKSTCYFRHTGASGGKMERRRKDARHERNRQRQRRGGAEFSSSKEFVSCKVS